MPDTPTHDFRVRIERRYGMRRFEFRATCQHPECDWTEKAADRETAEARGYEHSIRPHR